MWFIVGVLGVFGDRENSKRMLDPCPTPPDAMKRQSGWVQDNATLPYVWKHVRPTEVYLREKNITQMLSPFPHFPSLLSFDDDCHLLRISRVYQGGHPCLDAHIAVQLRYVFAVFDMLQLEPSTEFYYGFGSNMFLDTHRNVQFFDFGNYHFFRGPSRNPDILNTTLSKILEHQGPCPVHSRM